MYDFGLSKVDGGKASKKTKEGGRKEKKLINPKVF